MNIAFLGEEQRTIPKPAAEQVFVSHERILGRGAGEIGGAPWEVHGKRSDSSSAALRNERTI
jgi:hypothetical protein